MFTFLNFNRRYPNNSELSKYCMDSTLKSIRKMTREYNEVKRPNQGILIKKYFYENNDKNNNDNNDNNDNNASTLIKFISVLSAIHFTLNFLFNPK